MFDGPLLRHILHPPELLAYPLGRFEALARTGTAEKPVIGLQGFSLRIRAKTTPSSTIKWLHRMDAAQVPVEERTRPRFQCHQPVLRPVDPRQRRGFLRD